MSSSHDHSQAPANYNTAFAIGASLNISFVVIELWYGFASNSLALISDATHNATDVIGLFIAWLGIWLITRKPTSKHTFGLGRGSIHSTMINTILIFVAAGGILVEAIQRLSQPVAVGGQTIIWVALVGILINSFTAFLFMKGSKHDINIKGAFVHMAVDALVSAGVVVGGILISATELAWIDPLIGIVIALVIIITTWSLMKDSISLSMDAVPSDIDIQEVRTYLLNLPNVSDVHDLHIWAANTKHICLTVHIVKTDDVLDDHLTHQITEYLHDHFDIDHPTIQYEFQNSTLNCKLKLDSVL